VEARILLWQAGDFETLRLVAGGMSVYEAHARATMGWTGGILKVENPRLYALAKARVLGAGYGCGYKRFTDVAWAMARLRLTLGEATETIDAYRASNHRIVNYWRKHQFWFKVSVNHSDPTHEIDLPSGRTIKYFDPHVVEGSDPNWPEMAAYTVKGEARQLRRMYGGKFTENTCQAISRDALGHGIVGLDQAGIPNLFHAHDEGIFKVADDQVKDAVETINHDFPKFATWAAECPLSVETKVADRYFK
jgi:hypothetical protein